MIDILRFEEASLVLFYRSPICLTAVSHRAAVHLHYSTYKSAELLTLPGITCVTPTTKNRDI